MMLFLKSMSEQLFASRYLPLKWMLALGLLGVLMVSSHQKAVSDARLPVQECVDHPALCHNALRGMDGVVAAWKEDGFQLKVVRRELFLHTNMAEVEVGKKVRVLVKFDRGGHHKLEKIEVLGQIYWLKYGASILGLFWGLVLFFQVFRVYLGGWELFRRR
ncbi:MAG: hypothetical protein HQL53_04540 [Magnetococcales bacterium]|nr:hypothetical protein [Magnetococcales bacterium]